MACFHHVVMYRDFKDLPRRTTSVKVLYNQAFEIAQNDGYQCRLTSMVYKFSDKKAEDTSIHTGTRIIFQDQQLANEFHKQVTRKFQGHKVYLSCRNNILGADLADMQTCIITANVFGLPCWVLQSLLHSKKVLDESDLKRSKVWVNQVSDF